ncbi:MAG: 2-hydroxyacid dehydrogenase [Balneolaceae bacterium]
MPGNKNILIAEPIVESAIEKLREIGNVTVARRGELKSEKDLSKALINVDAFLSMLSNNVTKTVLKNAPRLKIVANHAVGIDNIDIKTAKKLGIRVSNTPDVLTDATADLALALMLAAARKFPAAENYLRNGKFHGWEPLGFLGTEISASTVGIVGMGRIGQAFARRVKAFGAKIIYHNRNRVPEKTEALLGAVYEPDLDKMLSEVDILSLHCPMNDETHHLINRKRLALLKNDSVIINTARGAIIDEEALAHSLHNHQIGGAGLDVYENEPEIHPGLLNAPNCILLPHIGSATHHTRKKMGELAANSIIGVLQNKPDTDIPNLVT